MTFFTEQPIRLGLVCLTIVLVALVVWVQTQKPAAFQALAGCLLLSLALLAVERLVESDAEAISAELYAAVSDLSTNNVQAVLGHLSTSANELRAQIELVMPRIQLDEVKITTSPEIRLLKSAVPPAATATFTVRASASWNGAPTGPFLGTADVRLVREREGWRIETAQLDTSAQGVLPGQNP